MLVVFVAHLVRQVFPILRLNRSTTARGFQGVELGPTSIMGIKPTGAVALPVDSCESSQCIPCAAAETFSRTVDFAAAGSRLWRDSGRHRRPANSPSTRPQFWVWGLHQVKQVTAETSLRWIPWWSTLNCSLAQPIRRGATRHRPQDPLHPSRW